MSKPALSAPLEFNCDEWVKNWELLSVAWKKVAGCDVVYKQYVNKCCVDFELISLHNIYLLRLLVYRLCSRYLCAINNCDVNAQYAIVQNLPKTITIYWYNFIKILPISQDKFPLILINKLIMVLRCFPLTWNYYEEMVILLTRSAP